MNRMENVTIASFNRMKMLKQLKLLEALNKDEIKRLIPTIIFLVIIFVAGLVGNSIVIHVYRTSYKVTTSAKCFILCLSLIDLLTCGFAIPLEVATILDQYTFENVWLCKISRVFNTLGTNSSAFLLLFIAVDRFRKVCKPFGWQIGMIGAKCLCGLAVLLGVVFSCPAILIYGKHSFVIPEINVTASECSSADEVASTNYPFYFALLYGIVTVGGIISLWILYCLIGLKIKRQRAKMKAVLGLNEVVVKTPSTLHLDIIDKMSNFDHSFDQGNKNETTKIDTLCKKRISNKVMRITTLNKIRNSFKSKENTTTQPLRKQTQTRKTTFVTFVITLAFILSAIPHLLLMLARQIKEDFINDMTDTNKAVYKFFLRSYFLNSAINPIIYSICDSRFISLTREMFNRCCKE